ncbi:MAG: hypothetical protein CJBNEKGG_03515 [Prosthecobacter sp.]|nr:hypothetical protein [Prosthecobacter sp.]
MARRLFHLLRLACAALLLGWVLHRLRWEEVVKFDWRKVDIRWLGVSLLLGGLSLLGWAGRWWWFLRVYDLRVPFRELLRLTLFADFFNLYFLGPLGADGVRLLHLSRRLPGQRGAVIGSLVLDHVGGLFGGIALYALFSRSGVLPPGWVSIIDPVLVPAFVFTVLGLGVIMEPPIQRLFARLPGLRRVVGWMSPLFAGTFRHPWLFSGFALSCLSTACAFGAFWASALAVALPVDLPLMLGLMPAVDFVASLPVSVSGLGVREGLLLKLLEARPGCDPVDVLAASLLGFAAIGLWGLAGGLWLVLGHGRGGEATPP